MPDLERPAAREEGRAPTRARRLWPAGAAVFLVALALYLPGLAHEFVWDDLSILMANDALGDWSRLGDNLSPGFFHEPGGERLADYWRPVVVLSHMVDRQLFGRSPRGPHLVNALLHGATALAVLLVCHAWSRSRRWALAAGLLFAVHPVHVEVVAWVSGRSDLLLGLFLAMALWADARHGQTGRRGWQAFALAGFALALLAKEAAVVFPALVAARVLLASPRPRDGAPSGYRRLLPVGASLVVLAVFLWVRFGLVGAEAPRGLAATADRISLFWTWWDALLLYLELLVWPARLTILHQVELASGPWAARVVAGLLACAALVWAGWSIRRRAPGAAFGIAALLLCLAPLSNFLIPVSQQAGEEFAVAERFLYAPAIGFCLFAGWGLAVWFPERLGRRAAGGAAPSADERAARRWPARVATAWLVVVLLALAARTERRLTDWSSDLALFGAAVLASPGSYLAHLNYAAARVAAAREVSDPDARRKMLDTAHRHYLEARELAPGNHRVHYDLANLERSLGRSEAAEASYRRALALAPALYPARVNLGTLLAQRGELEGALEQFAAAERLEPGLAAAKVNRAHVLQMLGRPREAIPLYEAALALDPELFAARDALRRARQATGREDSR